MTYYRCDKCGKYCRYDEIHIVSNAWLKKYFSSKGNLNIGCMCPTCISFIEANNIGEAD